MDRLILHCDLNNFYASVEGVLDPSLKDVPLAVAGSSDKRHGVVLAKNELAKSKGVRTGDVVWEARLKEPRLVVVPPRFEEYMRYSKYVFGIYQRFTPLVEPFGADECYLDCTGSEKLFGTGREIADKIRAAIREETRLTASVGVSFTKTFAKLGSDMKKPDATTEITRENFEKLIWSLGVSEMMGVGKSTAEKLKKLNITTIGELASADDRTLKLNFGAVGAKLKAAASGEDYEPVREAVKEREAESIGHGMTAVRDIISEDDATALIYYLSELVGARLRKKKLKGSGVSLDLRFNDLTHFSRQTKLAAPAGGTDEIASAAVKLLKANWDLKPLRTMTVSVFELSSLDESEQLCMFGGESREKSDRLWAALDAIREKYGADKIRRANLIARDFIYDKTDGEDFLPFQR